MWAASNITYLYIVLGGTMVLPGPNAGQSRAVVAGNLSWLVAPNGRAEHWADATATPIGP